MTVGWNYKMCLDSDEILFYNIENKYHFLPTDINSLLMTQIDPSLPTFPHKNKRKNAGTHIALQSMVYYVFYWQTPVAMGEELNWKNTNQKFLSYIILNIKQVGETLILLYLNISLKYFSRFFSLSKEIGI